MILKTNKLIWYLTATIMICIGIFVLFSEGAIFEALFAFSFPCGILYAISNSEERVEFKEKSFIIYKGKESKEILYDEIDGIKIRKTTDYNDSIGRKTVLYFFTFYDNKGELLFEKTSSLSKKELKELILFLRDTEPRLIPLFQCNLEINSILADIGLLSEQKLSNIINNNELSQTQKIHNIPLIKESLEPKGKIYLTKHSSLLFFIIFIPFSFSFFISALCLIVGVITKDFDGLLTVLIHCGIAFLLFKNFGKMIYAENNEIVIKRFEKIISTLKISDISMIQIDTSKCSDDESGVSISIYNSQYRKFYKLPYYKRNMQAIIISRLLREYPELKSKIKLKDELCPHSNSFLSQINFLD